MSYRIETPFHSIENAQEYIRLLAETVSECKEEIDSEVAPAAEQGEDRRVQALRIAQYNLQKLQRQLSVTSRTLNDLRSLRRLLHRERRIVTATNPANPEFELARK